jgi:Peptidase A4 family
MRPSVKTRLLQRPRVHAHSIRRLLAYASVAAALPLVIGAASVGSAPSGTPAGGCKSYFNPYQYTQSVVRACGYQTFPRVAVHRLPGGGSSYDYSVNGARVRFYVPPAGFDPSTASGARLAEYAFPPRPSNPAALARWQREMSNWKGAVTPPPFLAETHARADTVYSSNWAGYAVSGSSGTYTHAEAWYIEPSFGSSVCTSNSEVTWAGIGGYFANSPLGQDGTSHNVPGMNNHQAWWEVYPNNNIQPVNFYGHAGYLFDASTRRISGGYRFYMHDYYSGTTDAFDVSINNYDGRSAEAIAERPSVNGSLTNLSNFGTLTFSSSEANGSGINNYSPSGVRHGIHMENFNNGDDLADPSTIGSDGYFTVTQHHCN